MPLDPNIPLQVAQPKTQSGDQYEPGTAVLTKTTTGKSAIFAEEVTMEDLRKLKERCP